MGLLPQNEKRIYEDFADFLAMQLAFINACVDVKLMQVVSILVNQCYYDWFLFKVYFVTWAQDDLPPRYWNITNHFLFKIHPMILHYLQLQVTSVMMMIQNFLVIIMIKTIVYDVLVGLLKIFFVSAL